MVVLYVVLRGRRGYEMSTSSAATEVNKIQQEEEQEAASEAASE